MNEEYKKGYQAYLDCLPLCEDNPLSWIDGWCDAFDDSLRGALAEE
jgi:hypothetical protein